MLFEKLTMTKLFEIDQILCQTNKPGFIFQKKIKINCANYLCNVIFSICTALDCIILSAEIIHSSLKILITEGDQSRIFMNTK